MLARVFTVMTAAGVTGSLLFNFTTNGNCAVPRRAASAARIEDPALLGALLAAIYTIASLAQLVVGRLIDRVPLKPLYLGIVAVAGAAAGARRATRRAGGSTWRCSA